MRKNYLRLLSERDIQIGKKKGVKSINFVTSVYTVKRELKEERKMAKELIEHLQETGFPNVTYSEEEVETPGDDPLYLYERPLWRISLEINL